MATPKGKGRKMVGNSWPNNLPWMQMLQPTAKTDQEVPENITDFYSTMMQAGLEFTELCAQRSRAYMELPQQISRCKKPEDFVEVEIEFWENAYDQYKDFSSHSLPGPLSALGGLIDGQVPNGAGTRTTRSATKSAPKVQAKRKSPTRKKTTRRRAASTRDNDESAFSFPEHVEGRPDVRGRIH